MMHFFDTDIAEKVGVNAAVIFQNIAYWIKKNQANEEHYHDGTYWTYNSKAAWKALFPYMGEKQFKAALQKLIEEGFIKTGCYNSKPFDRTLWYALTEKGESMIPKKDSPLAQNRTMEEPKRDSPIPNNIPNSIPDNNNPLISPLEGKCDSEPDSNLDAQRFESFWKLYPNKKAKQTARTAWGKLQVDGTLYTTIMRAVTLQSKTEDWTKDGGKYVPHPATWLNGRRWEDEVKAAEPAEAPPLYKKLTLRR